MPSAYRQYAVPTVGEGGLNTAVHPTRQGDTDAQISQNVEYKVGGTFHKRPGYSQVGDTIHATNAIFGLTTFRLVSGVEWLVVAANNGTRGVFKYDSSDGSYDSISATVTVSTLMYFATYQDRLYFSNGTDDVQYANSSFSVTALATAPKVKGLTLHRNRLFGFGDSTNVSRLRYTIVGDGSDWAGAGSGFIDIDKSNGSPITGLSISEGALIVGKYPYGLYRVDFDSTDTPFVTQTPFEPGPTSHFGMSRVNNGALYLSQFEIDKVGKGEDISQEIRGDDISVKIHPDVQDFTTTSEAASAFWKQTWYLACRTSGSYNNLVYAFNIVMGTWSKYTNINANMFTIYGGNLHWGASNVGKIFAFNTTFSDPDDTAIELIWKWKESGLGADGLVKTCRWLDIDHIANVGTQLAYIITSDNDTHILRSDTLTITSPNADFASPGGIGAYSIGMVSIGGASGGYSAGDIYIPARISFQGRGKTFSVELSNSQLGKDVEVLGIAWWTKVRTPHNYDSAKIQ